tara:strand:+ start:37220 stop:37729 length:510 start_codon:yes stop_codon:yes gene_type:complete
MTLSFTEKIKDKKTYFVEKIWACLYYRFIDFDDKFYKYNQEYKEKFQGAIFVNFGITHPKRHTIRQDKSNRWKAGNKIHPVINNRTPQRFQFAPTIKCVSTQDIEIVWNYNNSSQKEQQPGVFIDGKEIDFETLINLAKNDGFDTVIDFLQYFDTNFTGKIIHWTNLKY